MPLSTGQNIGQYRILGRLGTGGMAEIYRAHQENIGRDVAIKILRTEQSETPEAAERFRREARMIASLSHPHIIKVFDYDRYKDVFYLVMELHEGGTLTDRIRAGRLLPETIGTTLAQVAQALDYIHNNGIIHRDLKPSNILFDRNGYAILTDFGISKREDTLSPLTAAGMAMGTLVFMAPEQVLGEPSDKRVDIYALGVMLFEMLTGKLPFGGTTTPTIVYSKLNDPLPSIRQLRPDVPASIQQVVEKALARNPGTRYQTAAELSKAYDNALKGSGPAPIAATPPPGDRTIPELPLAPPPGDRTIPELPPAPSRPVADDRTMPELPPAPSTARSARTDDRTIPELPPARPVADDRTMPELPPAPPPMPGDAPIISAPVRTSAWVVTRPVSESKRPSRLPILAVVVVILLLALGGGAIFLLGQRQPTPTAQPTAPQVAGATQAATVSSTPSSTAVPSATASPLPPTATASPVAEAITAAATEAPTEAATEPATPEPPTRTPTQAPTARKTIPPTPTIALVLTTFASISDVPTDFVPLLRYALKDSPSLKENSFNCGVYLQVVDNLDSIAQNENDKKQAADAKALVEAAETQRLKDYCSDPQTPTADHQLPQDQAMDWGTLRLLMGSTYLKYTS